MYDVFCGVGNISGVISCHQENHIVALQAHPHCYQECRASVSRHIMGESIILQFNNNSVFILLLSTAVPFTHTTVAFFTTIMTHLSTEDMWWAQSVMAVRNVLLPT